LIVAAKSTDSGWNTFSFFGASDYVCLDLRMDVPANLTVKLDVGYGDAHVTNVAQLAASVGSGNLDVKA
jgi:hypothetical protein